MAGWHIKQMNHKIKVAAEIISFLFLFTLVTGLLYGVLRYRDTGSGGGFDNFYSKKPNMIDVMIFGNSHAGCSFNTSQVWDNAGIACYTLTAGAQSIDRTYYYMREAFKTQHPKVALLETFCAVIPEENEDRNGYKYDLGSLYRTDLPMRWSPLYAEMILDQAEIYHLDHGAVLNLLTKMPIVHSRYAELDRSDFNNIYPFNCGFWGSYDIDPAVAPTQTDRREPISGLGEKYLQKIIQLCRDKNVSLVIYTSPGPHTEDEMAQLNTISDIAGKNNIKYINFNKIWKETGIDYAVDMRDSGHVNNSGAEKVTDFLTRYLQEKYLFADHRGDGNYSVWDLDSRYQKDKTLRRELDSADDLNIYLKALQENVSQYDFMISLDGKYDALGNVYDESLRGIGINEVSYKTGGSFVFSGGQVKYWSGGSDDFIYEGRFGQEDVVCARFHSETEDQWDSQNTTDKLIIGENNFVHAVNGVNFVLYDPVLDLVVDNISVNVYNGLKPEHHDEFTDVHI